MASTTYLSGLASNFDWATVIDQLMTVERKKVDVVTTRQDTEKQKLQAWNSFTGMLGTFRTKLAALRKVDDLNKLKISTTCSSATYAAADLVSISATSDASPGSHLIQMDAGCRLAQARQVSSQSFSAADEALGLTGEFIVNGRAVVVEATDGLQDVADRVNALNTGSRATHVTASVLAAGSNDYRLVLTSDDTGADSLGLQEGGGSTVLLRSGGLGFFESYGSSLKNATSDGAESDHFTSSGVSVKSLLGLSSAPGAVTVQVGGQDVSIDLSSDSETLSTIAAKIEAALGAGGSASVASETKDGVTSYYIDVSGTTSFSDSGNVLQALGFLQGTQTSVAQTLVSGNTLYTAASGGSAEVTAATSFNDIYGYTPGTSDTITIGGTTATGAALTPTTFSLYSGGYKTVDDLLTAIEGAFSAAGQTVTATVSGGKIQVSDSQTGSSQLSLSLVADNQGGGNLNLGAVSVQTRGYSQQTMAGQDAVLKVNGVYLQSSSNTIDEAIPGLTIDLQRVESGTTINVNVARDVTAVQASVQGMVDAYNDIITYVNKQFTYSEDTGAGGVLSGDFTLRGVKQTLQEIVADQIPGLAAGWNALSLIGVNSDSSGLLTINATQFSQAARNDFGAFRQVLGTQGTVTDADITYVGYGDSTAAGTYAINITQAAAQAAQTGWKDLGSGIGATGETLRITDTMTGRAATLAIDPAGNGASLSSLVNALNSELGATYAEVLVGSVANTASGGGALSGGTTWSNVSGATLSDFDVITFEGTDRTGNAVSGVYQITDTGTDTVQGLLSAIESTYGGQARAYLDASGRLVVQDTQSGDSSLSIAVTGPTGSGLDFGDIDVTEGAGDGSVQGRGALEVTASDDGSGHLVLSHTHYGSGSGFSVEQVSDPSGANQAVLLSGTANTTASSGGTLQVTAATAFDDIQGFTADTTDTIVISGTGHDGEAITGATFSLYGGGYKTLGDLLTAIEDAFAADGCTVTATIENGRIKLVDGETGLSGLGLSLTPQTVDPGLDLGSVGSAATGLAGGTAAGLDVAGTINGEACTGSGRLLTGATPGFGETSSVAGISMLVNLTAAQLATQGSSQGTVTLTTGAMERFWRAVEGMLAPSDGSVTLRTGSIQNGIDGMDDTIAQMEARLTQHQEQLTAQYVALEQAVSHLKSISSWLSSQVSALGSN